MTEFVFNIRKVIRNIIHGVSWARFRFLDHTAWEGAITHAISYRLIPFVGILQTKLQDSYRSRASAQCAQLVFHRGPRRKTLILYYSRGGVTCQNDMFGIILSEISLLYGGLTRMLPPPWNDKIYHCWKARYSLQFHSKACLFVDPRQISYWGGV